jgi:hypothetical protein
VANERVDQERPEAVGQRHRPDVERPAGVHRLLDRFQGDRHETNLAFPVFAARDCGSSR